MSKPTKATEALITIDAVTQEAENRLRHPYCSGERRMDFRHGADWAISVYEPERQRLIALLADMEGEAHPSPTAADAKDSAVDVKGVIKAGDELTKIKGALCNFILSLAPRDRDGHFTKDELDRMTDRWTKATKPFRP